MKVLLTGFEPFGGETINPSLEAVKRVSCPGAEVRAVQIPVEYARSVLVLQDAIRSFEPDAVICVGQAGGREGITPEKVAINLDDASAPDNSSVAITDSLIIPDGPTAYFSTLPVKKMIASMKESGISAHLSYSAGAYVCNHLMYSLLHHYAVEGRKIPAGFIHVPFLPEQVQSRPGTPCMPLEEIVKGLEIAVSVLLESFLQKSNC